jgi:type IV pilus assembly protein PilB
VTRLIEMGIEPFLVGSAVDCVLAQRLARRLCPKCKEAYQPTTAALEAAGLVLEPGQAPPRIYRAVGCSVCARTGYKGRVALHEVLPITERIEHLAVERASSATIAMAAREEGMQTLREDGLAKVLAGVTSLDEVLRVVA